MARLYFHGIYAWNLIADAIREGIIGPEYANNYMRARIAEGIRDRWITHSNGQRARELFVFSDQAVLGSGVEMPAKNDLVTRGHMAFSDQVMPTLRRSRVSEELGQVRELKGFIVAGLRARGIVISDEVFNHVIDIAEKARDYDGWGALGQGGEIEKEIQQAIESAGGVWVHEQVEVAYKRAVSRDPRSAMPDFWTAMNAIAEEYYFLSHAMQLAEQKIPAFGPGNAPSPILQRPAGAEVETSELVALYFRNVLRCPSPPTLEDAVALRQHDAVLAWRAKVADWSRCAASQEMTPRDIEQEIGRGNDDLESAVAFTRIAPTWIHYVALTAGVASLVYPPAKGVAILLEYYMLHCHTVAKALQEKNSWLMVTVKDE